MAGNVGNIGSPLAVDRDDVNQIPPTSLLGIDAPKNSNLSRRRSIGGAQHLVKISGERYLRLNAYVTFPFSRDEEDETSIGEGNADDGSGGVHSKRSLISPRGRFSSSAAESKTRSFRLTEIASSGSARIKNLELVVPVRAQATAIRPERSTSSTRVRIEARPIDAKSLRKPNIENRQKTAARKSRSDWSGSERQKRRVGERTRARFTILPRSN
jgi:hypothetical protein